MIPQYEQGQKPSRGTNTFNFYRIMEAKSKEELALMGKEELEALALHLQDEVQSVEAALKSSRELKDMFYDRATLMEQRISLMLQLLKSWDVK